MPLRGFEIAYRKSDNVAGMLMSMIPPVPLVLMGCNCLIMQVSSIEFLQERPLCQTAGN